MLKTSTGLSKLCRNVECKLTLQQARKVQKGNIGIAVHFFNLDTICCGWNVLCTKSDNKNLIDKS